MEVVKGWLMRMAESETCQVGGTRKLGVVACTCSVALLRAVRRLAKSRLRLISPGRYMLTHLLAAVFTETRTHKPFRKN